MEEIKIFAELFQIRTQAHWLHLQTTLYPEHKSLDEFYTEWGNLTDLFVETYFGKYGRVDGSFLNAVKSYSVTNSTDFVNAIYANFLPQLDSLVKAEDTDLQNIIADMKGLCNHTKYLLTLR